MSSGAHEVSCPVAGAFPKPLSAPVVGGRGVMLRLMWEFAKFWPDPGYHMKRHAEGMDCIHCFNAADFAARHADESARVERERVYKQIDETVDDFAQRWADGWAILRANNGSYPGDALCDGFRSLLRDALRKPTESK